MDEPSTGLDPASRNSLWSVVKQAKRDRAIILTSISLSLSLCTATLDSPFLILTYLHALLSLFCISFKKIIDNRR